MSVPAPLKIIVGNFPVNFTDSPLGVFKAFIRRLRCYLSENDVITGKTSGTAPIYNVGPWFYNLGSNDSHFWVWSDTQGGYVPDIKQVAANGFVGTLSRELNTSSNSLTLRDLSGTVALLIDVLIPRATVVIPSSNIIDWATGDQFVRRLTANTTFTFANLTARQICVSLENNGTAHTATFPAAVKWPGGVVPTMPTASAGIDKVGVFYFYRNNGTTYGELGINATTSPLTALPPSGQDSVPTDYGYHGGKVPTQPL